MRAARWWWHFLLEGNCKKDFNFLVHSLLLNKTRNAMNLKCNSGIFEAKAAGEKIAESNWGPGTVRRLQSKLYVNGLRQGIHAWACTSISLATYVCYSLYVALPVEPLCPKTVELLTLNTVSVVIGCTVSYNYRNKYCANILCSKVLMKLIDFLMYKLYLDIGKSINFKSIIQYNS